MSGDERDCSDKQHPRASKPAAAFFHSFDPWFAGSVITHGMEPSQEQSASRRFPLHRSSQFLIRLLSAGRRGLQE